MSSVNYSLKHKGVRLISSEDAWVKGKNGKRRGGLIPIENYNTLTKPSGIDPHVYKEIKYRKPIKESKLIKTNSRLNKWDMKKISHLK